MLQYPVNTDADEYDATMSSDGTFIVFSAAGRNNSFGSSDLYVTFRTRDKWSEPVNLGSEINSEFPEVAPIISPSGKVIYFSSSRNSTHPFENGKGNIYAFSVEVIRNLSPG